MPPPSKTFRSHVVRNGSARFIPLTFDPKPVFGKVRAAVKVTVTGHTFRGTIAAIGGSPSGHQREHVEAIEQAKKPEARARRLSRSVSEIQPHGGLLAGVGHCG